MDHWDLVWCALHNFFPFDDLGYPEEGEVYRVEYP
jgi:hypothetical protein